MISQAETLSEKTRWRVRCVCGTVKVVRQADMRNGRIVSCGCAKKERAEAMGLANRTHGKRSSPEYTVWRGLIARCTNRGDSNYARYGGRGIRVCARWRKSFENFFADMGRRPSPKHQIDRRDNDGDYEPKNCRWVTLRTQYNNRSTNVRVTFRGDTLTIAQWARHLKLPMRTLWGRLQRWSVRDALTRPVRVYRRRK